MLVIFITYSFYLTAVEKGRSAFKILASKPTGKRPYGGLGVDGRTILELILKK